MIFPLKGNARVKEAVEQFISAHRMPHAIIIEGDPGTGRHTLAKYIAKAAVCEGENRPCGSCRSCHLADIGTHPDIEWVAPAEKKKNISVDQIRELRTTAYHSPHTSETRAFIIEQAETMNAHAQNSILKALEEPPGKVIFILLTVAAERLLNTVVSRCTVLSLFPPATGEAVKELCDRGYSRDEALAALGSESGNVGKALELLGGKNSGTGAELARDYFAAITKGELLDAMLLTAALESNRPEVGKFTVALKELLHGKIKDSMAYPQTAREYIAMLDAVNGFEALLATNINLGLYFTALTSKLTAVRNKK